MPKLYTIGHSTHTLAEFLGFLQVYKITHLVDIRSVPRSRHVPWFNKDELKQFLNKHKIRYTHLAALGGLRRTQKDSINQAWKNLSFRGYADYMQTLEYYEGLKKLNSFLKRGKNVVIMCAEAVPWRCHRSMVADSEVVRGVDVIHILSHNSVHLHKLTPFAAVNRKKRPIQVYYPKKDPKHG